MDERVCPDPSPSLPSLRFAAPATGRDPATHRHHPAVAVGPLWLWATLEPLAANPIAWVAGRPAWAGAAPADAPMADDGARAATPPQFLQVLTLSGFGPGADLRLGLADDRRGGDRGHLTLWVSDGELDYFGPFLRPHTPADFLLQLDASRTRLTAWVRNRGDEAWFLLIEAAALAPGAWAAATVSASLWPGGPGFSHVQLTTARPAAEAGHPRAKRDRVVQPGAGFHFPDWRSTWRRPGRQVTIFRRTGHHAGFPDVALAGPAHLVCVWRNGSHTGGTGGISVAHSYDLGQTWEPPTRVTALPGNCPRLQRLANGSLLLLVDVPSHPDQFRATWELRLWDSHDEGQTWVNPRCLDPRQTGGGGCIVPSRIAELADGSWLLAASYFAPPPGPGRYVEILDYYRSIDCGHTWELLGQPYHWPPFCLSEPSPVALPDGRLLVLARESRTDGRPGARGWSQDGGRTWTYSELPYPITGRTCAGRLRSGRLLNTFRSGIGRAALRAWIGAPDDATPGMAAGAHFNDRYSIGLRDGWLHVDNDGYCGQFTQYTLPPPVSSDGVVELEFTVEVRRNDGRAATVSIPYTGRLRLGVDHVALAHAPQLRQAIAPGRPHVYRAVSRPGRFQLWVDGHAALDTDQGDGRWQEWGWTRSSIYCLSFGNEARGCGANGSDSDGCRPDVYAVNITPEVTGYSRWQRFAAGLEDPAAPRWEWSWDAAHDGFPDQYQLDHMLEIEASVNGHDQGYSGWVELPDGRVFVVHYTDDTAPAVSANAHHLGVPWIRGTFLEPDDLLPG